MRDRAGHGVGGGPRVVGSRSRGVVARRRGFTMVELLVVITIIAILIGLVIGVAAAVLGGQNAAATRNVLFSLDRVLDEYVTTTGANPIYSPGAWAGRPGPTVGTTGVLATVATGPESLGFYDNRPHVRRPEVGVALDQMQGFGVSGEVLEALPTGFVRSYRLPEGFVGGSDQSLTRQTIADAWTDADWGFDEDPTDGVLPAYPMAGEDGATLVYFVHPENQLAQDLFGRCQNGRPYFVSAGADRRYGLGGGVEQAEQGDDSDAQYRDRIRASLEDNLTSYPVGSALFDEDFFNNVRDLTR